MQTISRQPTRRCVHTGKPIRPGCEFRYPMSGEVADVHNVSFPSMAQYDAIFHQRATERRQKKAARMLKGRR